MPNMIPPDLFGDGAVDYARYRPSYPESLFDHLAALAPARRVAWDCGTGNGQSARGLARWFETVVASDASVRQLEQAVHVPGVHFIASTAEHAPVRSRSVDLVTVSAALHWFDRPEFFAEVSRVARPGAVIAAWSYFQSRIEPAIDEVLERYADQVVGACWEPGIHLNREGYRGLDFPFARLPWPELESEARMSLEDLLAFMRTWSASQAWVRARGTDPVELVRDDLLRVWGDPATQRPVRWPLHGVIGLITR